MFTPTEEFRSTDLRGIHLNIQVDAFSGRVWACLDGVAVMRVSRLESITLHNEPVVDAIEMAGVKGRVLDICERAIFDPNLSAAAIRSIRDLLKNGPS